MHAIYITGSVFALGNPFLAAHSMSKDKTLMGAIKGNSDVGKAFKH